MRVVVVVVGALGVLALAGCGKAREVSAAGLTLTVPARWNVVDQKEARPGQLGILVLAVRRQFSSATGIVTLQENEHGAVTLEEARKWQRELPEFGMNDGGGAAGVERFEVASGKYRSVCIDGRVVGGQRYMLCEIVGTALQMNYSGAAGFVRAARQMLATLR
jgi:hypothetical protein